MHCRFCGFPFGANFEQWEVPFDRNATVMRICQGSQTTLEHGAEVFQNTITVSNDGNVTSALHTRNRHERRKARAQARRR